MASRENAMQNELGTQSLRDDLPGYLHWAAAAVDSWDHGDDADAVGRRDLELVLDNGELHLVYQPWMDLTSATYTTVEALVRWDHPTRGPVGPAEFIPVAERTGVIQRLGAWIIERACEQLRSWREGDGHASVLRMAVNLSACQLSDPDLVTTVTRALAVNGLESQALCLEVTESALMDDEDAGLTALHALRDLGVAIAIDDFGTGYSSLAQLKRLPADIVKIPREFIAGIADETCDAIIVAAIVEMAHALGIWVVTEGVETVWQAIAVRALDVEFVQGFYFSR